MIYSEVVHKSWSAEMGRKVAKNLRSGRAVELVTKKSQYGDQYIITPVTSRNRERLGF